MKQSKKVILPPAPTTPPAPILSLTGLSVTTAVQALNELNRNVILYIQGDINFIELQTSLRNAHVPKSVILLIRKLHEDSVALRARKEGDVSV